MHNSRLSLLALLMLLSTAACDSEGGEADAGRLDAGAMRDAAGPSVDAGPSGADAGPSSDAGPPADAGQVDGGEGSEDAGGVDGGSIDAGVADAGPPTGQSCADPIDATAGGTFGGTTDGAGDNQAPPAGCVAGRLATGPDVAYFVQPEAETSYRFRVEPDGATYDPMLYALVDDCDASSCLAGTVLNGPGEPETSPSSRRGARPRS